MHVDEIRRIIAKPHEKLISASGDHALNPDIFDADALANAKPAAVLIGFINRENTTHVLLTQRADALRNHSGQVVSPAGGWMRAKPRLPPPCAKRTRKSAFRRSIFSHLVPCPLIYPAQAISFTPYWPSSPATSR